MPCSIDPGRTVHIVSDMHMGDGSATDPFCGNDGPFLHFLEQVRRESDALVIAGDGFDLAQAWSLDRICRAHREVVDALRALARVMPVYYLHGNHDEAPDALGPLQLRLCQHLTIGDRIWVEHGNAFDPRNLPGDRLAFWGSRAHALLERVIHSPVRIPMRKHYYWSTRLGHWIFFRYGLYRRHKATALRWLGREMAAQRCLDFLDYWGRGEWGDIHGLLAPAETFLDRSPHDMLIWGHSHQAGRVAMSGGIYLNSGSWTYRDATYIRYRDGDAQVLNWRTGQPIEDEEYRGIMGPPARSGPLRQHTFFDWWESFYRGRFCYDVEAMHRAVRGADPVTARPAVPRPRPVAPSD